MQTDTATCTRVKWFWAWDAPKEEKWLERMAREGWFLVSGGIVFRFRRGTPAECRYRLDYRTETEASLKEYIGLCQDAGWEHVARFANWHYFHCSDPEAPELHTDPESLAERYKRLLAVLVVLLMVNLLLFASRPQDAPSRFEGFYSAMDWIRAGVVALLAYAIIRIGTFIRRLRAGAPHGAA